MKVYEFNDHNQFKDAARVLFQEDKNLKFYSFLPEDELIENLKMGTSTLAKVALSGLAFGFLFGFLLQYIPNVLGYSFNIGGKPLNSWPAFFIITFEMGILSSSLSIFTYMMVKHRWPRYDHDIFALDAYEENRHKHYFILTQKEESHVSAYAVHDLPDPS